MLFKFTGQSGQKALELVVFGIMDKDEELKENQVIEVPDDNKRLVSSLDAHGLFTRVEKEEPAPVKDKKTKPKRRND